MNPPIYTGSNTMHTTYNISTININGITTYLKFRLLHEFIQYHNCDVISLQEVVHDRVRDIPQYTTHINIGTEGRRTAVMVKDCFTLNNIRRIPNGHGIAGEINGIKIINIYAPSGHARRRERECFFNSDLIQLLQDYRERTIIAGDF